MVVNNQQHDMAIVKTSKEAAIQAAANEAQEVPVAKKSMKKFNQEIRVTISVDSIADKLMASFAEGFAHKEMVAEAIIGSLLPTDQGITNLFNTLNGYTLDVDFVVGQEVECSTKTYQNILSGEGGTIQSNCEIGLCKVVEIDVYRPNKLKVEWWGLDSSGNSKIKDLWVSHLNCSGVQMFSDEEMAFAG